MAILPKAIYRFHTVATKIPRLRCMEPLKTQNRPRNPPGRGKPEASNVQISNCITKL